MKKLFFSMLIIALFLGLLMPTAQASGGKEHGTVGNGYVYQEDPVGPGEQPDWQN